MQAYHNDPTIKEQYLFRVRAHWAADELIKGTYWEGGKGCAVGCTVHSQDHNRYETELGIPQVLARLEDGLFEALEDEAAMEWPERFLDAIRPGADLSLVWPRFAAWLLADEPDGVVRFAQTNEQRVVFPQVADLYQRWVDGDKPTVSVWRSAYAAARAAHDDAHAAARAATYDADAAATYAAAYAAHAVRAAARAAYDDADADAATYAAAYAAHAHAAAHAADVDDADARSRARSRQADKLIELLRMAPALS